MKFLFSFIFVSLFFFVSALHASAQTFPKPVGYVNDYANLYSQGYKTELEKTLQTFEGSTSAEVVVVTVTDLQGITIEEYAVKLFENWKIGKDKADNGVLFLIARDEREVRIEVGYGLEGELTDSQAGRIIRDDVIPSFKNGSYEDGTTGGITAIMRHIRGEPVASTSSESDYAWVLDFIPFLLFGAVYIGSFLARSKEYYAGGIVGVVVGLLIGLVVGQAAVVFFLMVVLGIIGLLLDFMLSKNYQYLKSHNKSTDWWHSRGGFSGGRSSGGFGGFGGGSSGGGGASGRW